MQPVMKLSSVQSTWIICIEGLNGILRNIARKKKTDATDPNLSTAENLSLLYSYPQWLVEK